MNYIGTTTYSIFYKKYYLSRDDENHNSFRKSNHLHKIHESKRLQNQSFIKQNERQRTTLIIILMIWITNLNYIIIFYEQFSLYLPLTFHTQ